MSSLWKIGPAIFGATLSGAYYWPLLFWRRKMPMKKRAWKKTMMIEFVGAFMSLDHGSRNAFV